MTIPIRARKITTGWGTMFPTFSIPSRNRCITVFGAVALIASVMIWPSSEMIAHRGAMLFRCTSGAAPRTRNEKAYFATRIEIGPELQNWIRYPKRERSVVVGMEAR